MADSFVSYRDVALSLGMDASACRRWLLREGFQFHDIYRNNQPAKALTAADAERAIDLRMARGERPSISANGQVGAVFYLIQLVPELDPSRIKMGFSFDLDRRANEHRTTCPTLEIVRSWPCRPEWEPAAMATASVHCALIAGEVYEADTILELTRVLERFFDMLPAIGQ